MSSNINPSNPVPPIGRPHSAQIIPTNHHSSPAANTPPNQERTPIPIILLRVITNTAFKSCMIGTVRNQTRTLKSCIIGIVWPCKTAWCDSERTERENAAQIGATIGINTIFYFIIPLWEKLWGNIRCLLLYTLGCINSTKPTFENDENC